MSAAIPYGRILKRRSCAVWPRKAKMALKPGGFWHLRRSMTVRRHRGGLDRRCRASDDPGLGVALQRSRT